MDLLLDTSAYSAAQRGDKRVLAALNDAWHIYLPLIVVGELKAGFAFGNKAEVNERLLAKFMSDAIVSVISISEKTAVIFAQHYAAVRKSGYTIGQNDLWLAALASEHQLQILTLDDDFSRVPGLTVAQLS